MFVLALILVPILELVVFVEVARAIGWLLAILLLLGTSLLGVRLLRVQSQAAIERFSLEVYERRAPARAAIDGALGFVGGLLLVVPGFLTDILGALLVLRPTRTLTRRWISAHYLGWTVGFLATAGRRARNRGGPQAYSGTPPASGSTPPADFESTVVEDDPEQLGR
jgi:UPF0716 protein FxsA